MDYIELNTINDDLGLRNMIITAVDQYKISFKTLKLVSNICVDSLIAVYEGRVVKESYSKVMHLYSIFLHLLELLPLNSNYTNAIIDTLVNVLNVTYETIAIFSEVEESKIKSFFESNNTLSDEDNEKLLKGSLHICAAFTKTDKSFQNEN